jgi:hypothetical protein
MGGERWQCSSSCKAEARELLGKRVCGDAFVRGCGRERVVQWKLGLGWECFVMKKMM